MVRETGLPELLVEGATGYAEESRGGTLVPAAEGKGSLEAIRHGASSTFSFQSSYSPRPPPAVTHMLGQHAETDRTLPAQIPQPLEEIEEFPYIAGPPVALQAPQGRLLDEDKLPL